MQGVLGIQTNLINLYAHNLSAIATQSALIGGFSFGAVIAHIPAESIREIVLSYLYYTAFTVCLVSALIILSQATIAGMFGPTMALKGSTDEAVKFAAAVMFDQQFFILRFAIIAVSALFFGALTLSWSHYPDGIAIIVTVVYVVAYYFMVKEGYQAYYTFVPNQDTEFVNPEGTTTTGTAGK